ncbi:MAG TPA: PilZ domain-containing protein [Longimicrobiaceae bacterium]|nr:PilZ domain-containing protein [Longimicrobiaceae bacterium]
MRSNPRREFLRHTIGVPLEVRELPGATMTHAQSRNVSFGGLAYDSEECPEIGSIIEIGIPTVEPPFQARARVSWCRPENDAYLVGIEFLESGDAFQARMVQQVCSIENYRREKEANEGRDVTTEEAAREWIEKYGGRFPDTRIANTE